MKTNKKQRQIGYGVALLTLCVSFLVWTFLLSFSQRATAPQNTSLVVPDWNAGSVVSRSAKGVQNALLGLLPGQSVSLFPAEAPAMGEEWQLEQAYELSIPKIQLHASVFLPERTEWDRQNWLAVEQQMQTAMREGLAAYPHSSSPGEGPVFVTGHSSPPDGNDSANGMRLFERLPELEAGDTVTLLQDGHYVDYEVRTLRVIPADETDVLLAKDNTLQLITCFPVGTTKDRLVVEAVQVHAG